MNFISLYILGIIIYLSEFLLSQIVLYNEEILILILMQRIYPE